MMRHRALGGLTVLATLTACNGAPTTSAGTGASASAGANSSAVGNRTAITGTVKLPATMVAAGAINLFAAGSMNLVAAGSMNLIAAGGVNLGGADRRWRRDPGLQRAVGDPVWLEGSDRAAAC